MLFPTTCDMRYVFVCKLERSVLLWILGDITCTECRNPPFGTQYYNATNDCRDKCVIDSNEGCSNFKVCTFNGEFTECICPTTGTNSI